MIKVTRRAAELQARDCFEASCGGALTGNRSPASASEETEGLLASDITLDIPKLREVARFAVKHAGATYRIEDLEQEAWLGILAAARSFDPANGAAFPTYAHHRAKGAVMDAMRRADPASTRHRKQIRDGECQPISILGIQDAWNVPAVGPNPEAAAIRRDHSGLIARSLHQLAPHERYVIEETILNERPPKAVAFELGVTPDRVYYLRATALTKLRCMLSPQPPVSSVGPRHCVQASNT